MFKERREVRRRAFNRVARFLSDDGSLPRSCTITDISDGGARLYSEFEVPPNFTLSVLGDDGGMQRRCRVVWRLGGELGVEFIDRPR